MAFSKIAAENLGGSTLPALAGGSLTGVGGLTEVDTWRLTTSFTGNDDWTAMERVDTDASGHIGTGLSNSSGIFTFPSTGYWWINCTANFLKANGTGQRLVGVELYFTTNNSSYTSVGWSRQTLPDETGASEDNYCSMSFQKLFDITDVGNQKFKLYSLVNSDSNVTTKGDTNDSISGFTIMKLGDT